jgi:hypothetical protein
MLFKIARAYPQKSASAHLYYASNDAGFKYRLIFIGIQLHQVIIGNTKYKILSISIPSRLSPYKD